MSDTTTMDAGPTVASLLAELDEALTGLREPLTLADARRVRDVLRHNDHLRRMARVAACAPLVQGDET